MDDHTITEDQPLPSNTVSADIFELMRVRRVKNQLDLLAYLFERYGSHACRGDCSAPVNIAAMYPTAITCCNLQPVHQYYQQLVGLETALQDRIQSHRRKWMSGAKDLVLAVVAAGIITATSIHVHVMGSDHDITTTEAAVAHLLVD